MSFKWTIIWLNETFLKILMNIKQLNSYKSVTNIREYSIVKSKEYWITQNV